MTVCTCDSWQQFLAYVKERSSPTAFENWFQPIIVVEETEGAITLQIPNIFVKDYLLSNYKEDLVAFLPITAEGEPAIRFIVQRPTPLVPEAAPVQVKPVDAEVDTQEIRLNPSYRFDSFIEGPSNQFVKSAAMGVAARPGQTYNPLFIHGGVGLGKTHLLHSIGNSIREHHKNLKVQYTTSEAFTNDLVNALRNKSIDEFKRYWRNNVDVLLVDDIQFLQNRLNFEEEFCNTFEALINAKKQIVITSDKPPTLLKLSERMIARMEWGLVAHVGIPDLETRVAILLHKAQAKGLHIPSDVAFFMAEHINHNVRQLEGAINRLSAHAKLMNHTITEEFVEKALREMLHQNPSKKISVEQILKGVAAVFQVRVMDLKGTSRTKDIALPRQVAMYMACKMIQGTLQGLSDSFGKAHSTILHACKAIEKKLESDEILRRQITMVEKNIEV